MRPGEAERPQTRHPLAGRVSGEALLLHQSHPAKLAVDVLAAIISGLLLWRRRPLPGLAVRYLLPLVGSAAVLARADLSRHRERRAGRYMLDHMPPGAQGLRFVGDLLMALGAWRRQPPLIAMGGALVLVGWAHGLLPGGARRPSGPAEPSPSALSPPCRPSP
ncbi:MAG TPA: hypothetical protein VKY90_16990 [Candidatus Dormibacteraeota bacterium]|nr:hypothetical protein [Candidatus Dormibacteraeota bacterium]